MHAGRGISSYYRHASRRTWTMADSPTFVLVDGSSYLFRAFHAMPSFTNSDGAPTGATLGVVNMLRRLRADYPSEYFAVIFDAPGKTFRDEWYPEYKANRPPMPDELRAQIATLHEIIVTLGMPLLCVPGVEADDVIGTLAERARERGFRVYISTNDKDMAQLVDGRVTLVNTMDDSVMDAAGVEAKFGVPPGRIVDYLTLVGDSVDNIPGVPKVGPKTAVKWLAAHGSLEGVKTNAAAIGGKVGEYLRAFMDPDGAPESQMDLSHRLVTIRRDVELDEAPETLRPRPMDRDALEALYRRLQFRTLLRELLEGTEGGPATGVGPGNATAEAGPDDGPAADASVGEASYETVLTEEAFGRWMERLESADLFSFDTETTSLDYMEARVVGVALAVAPGEGAYVPFGHHYPGAPEQLGEERVLGALRPLLEDPERAKVGHNLKYDKSVLANHGIEMAGIAHDTMLASYAFNSTATRHDMDTLATRYLGIRTRKYEEVAGKGAKQITFDQVPLEEAGPYAAEDAEVTLRLHGFFVPRLAERAGPERVYETIEIPLVPVLSAIERRGVQVDTNRLRALSEELAVRMDALERAAHAEADGPFNLQSPKQIQAILFGEDGLGLPVRTKTPKGQPSTADSVLQDLAREHALPRTILDHRALSKLRSTYTVALAESVSPVTGRVHTSYHQAVASTGRLSSSAPNLQNIPVRTAEGRRIRQAFIPPAGFRLVAADYSQIELRIMAHLSGDEGLVSAFAAGRDIHRATAAEVGGVDEAAVDGEMRRRAKAVNFGLIYGMSAFGLARQLGIERAEAQAYIERYFERYPGVRAYMEATRERARDQGYVETVFGRRLYLPDIKSRNAARRQYAERTAINAPMQGTAADVIKRAMVSLDEWAAGREDEVRMIMQVHDELVFEVAEPALEEATSAISERMARAAEELADRMGVGRLRVPLEVEAGNGMNWDEAH